MSEPSAILSNANTRGSFRPLGAYYFYTAAVYSYSVFVEISGCSGYKTSEELHWKYVEVFPIID